jgi:hypothetical protein
MPGPARAEVPAIYMQLAKGWSAFDHNDSKCLEMRHWRDDCGRVLKINGLTALRRRANKSSECVSRWRNRCECLFLPTSLSWELFFLQV